MKNRYKLLGIFALLAVSAFPFITQADTTSLAGVYNIDNMPSLTLGYCNQFGSCSGGALTLNGATSGSTTIQPNATAGSGTLTLPTTTDTLLGNASSTYGTPFGSVLAANPFTQDNYTDTVVSTSLTSASLTTIIAPTSGRKIYPINVNIMVSGTAATATALALECSDGTLIAQWPIALLTSNNPLNAFSSTAVTRGVALGSGCPVSTGVMLSNVGTNITTTTHVYTNVLHTIQ